MVKTNKLSLNNEIELIFDALKGLGAIKNIFSTSSSFFDEPKLFVFKGVFGDIGNAITNSGYTVFPENINTAGTSFSSKSIALLKCLSEGIERICIASYRKTDITYAPRADMPKALNLGYYGEDRLINDKKFGWVNARDISHNSNVEIPAQLIYHNYLSNNKSEKQLAPIISTGASSGMSYVQTLLRGIYEVVERDAFMTVYLNKITVPEIDVEKLNDKKIKKIADTFKKYKLEWRVLDITHDLSIPVMLSILIDKSQFGPSVTFGLKCGFNKLQNIVGSGEEALMVRLSARKLVQEGTSKNYEAFSTFEKIMYYRSIYWWSIDMLKKIDFFLNGKKTALKKSNIVFLNEKTELNYVITLLADKSHFVYCKDITHDYFKTKGIIALKTIIPTLQPLFFKEQGKYLNSERLKEVAQHYGKTFSTNTLNTILHPFL
jgi:ribosomal protein S12 methylthiotransferase accessory factor